MRVAASQHKEAGTVPSKKDERKVYDEYQKQEKERIDEAFEESESKPKGSRAEEIRQAIADGQKVTEGFSRSQWLISGVPIA